MRNIQGMTWAALLMLSASGISWAKEKKENKAEQGDVVVITPNNARTLVFHGNSLNGPQTNIAVDKSGVRGSVGGAPVNLTTGHGKVNGTIGNSGITDLKVTGSAAEGSAKGKLPQGLRESDFQWSNTALSGTVGRCVYQLTGGDGNLSGQRTCEGGSVLPLQLKMSSDFLNRPPESQAAVLGLVLMAP